MTNDERTIRVQPGVTPHWSGVGYTVYYTSPIVWVYHDEDRVEVEVAGKTVPVGDSGYVVEWAS